MYLFLDDLKIKNIFPTHGQLQLSSVREGAAPYRQIYYDFSQYPNTCCLKWVIIHFGKKNTSIVHLKNIEIP